MVAAFLFYNTFTANTTDLCPSFLNWFSDLVVISAAAGSLMALAEPFVTS